MANLNNINQLRTIQWSYKHLWDIVFETNKEGADYLKDIAPFDQWLPAISVEDTSATLETKLFEAANTTFEVPNNTSSKTLSITFIDDIDLTLYQWFKKWINIDILNNGEGLSSIKSCLRKITIRQLDTDMIPISLSSYNVYPKGNIVFNGTSESGNQEITVELVKVEVTEDNIVGDKEFSTKSVAKEIINKISGGIRYSDV